MSSSAIYVICSPVTIRGGVYQYWERMAPLLNSEGLPITLITEHSKVHPRIERPLRLGLKSALWMLRFSLRLRGEEAVRVVTSISQSDILFGLIGKRVCSASWTVVVHGQPYPVAGQTNGLKSYVWRKLWLLAVSRADYFVSVSDYTSKYAPPRQVKRTVIYPPLPLAIRTIERAANRAEREQIARVGFVGRMSFEKDPELFAHLSSTMPHYRFIAFGDGARLDALRARYSSVTWEGSADKARIYASIDIMFVTSRSEGLGLAILEAFASGVPVIATDVGGIREAVNPSLHALLLVPYESRLAYEEWLSRTQTVLRQREEILQEQHAWMVERFNSEVAVTKWSEVLDGN